MLQDYWRSLAHVIRHPHAWVRSAASRLLGFYFSACGEAARGPCRAGRAGQDTLLAPGMLVLLAGSICHVLRTEAEAQSSGVHAEQLAEQCVKNLLFLVPLLRGLGCTARRQHLEDSRSVCGGEAASDASGDPAAVGSSVLPGKKNKAGALVAQLAAALDQKDQDAACHGWGLLWGGKQKLLQGMGRPTQRSAGLRFNDTAPGAQLDQPVLLPIPEGLASELSLEGSRRSDCQSQSTSGAAVPSADLRRGTDDASAPHPLLVALVTSLGDVALQMSPVQVSCQDAYTSRRCSAPQVAA